MATATWEFEEEVLPGQIWNAGDDDITAGQDTIDGFIVYAGQIGEVTNWTLEDK